MYIPIMLFYDIQHGQIDDVDVRELWQTTHL